MKKNASMSLPNMKSVTRFVRRYNLILFFLAVSTALFVAIAILLPITNLSSGENSTATNDAVNPSFDEATIKQLRDGSSSSYTPGDRQSPFTE
jgi:hypothetical protein